MTLYKGTTPIAGIGKFQTNAGWNIFDCKWSDHILNDIQWLRADTFSWQSGSVYVSAYNHLVSDISGITSETETIGSYTVTFYRATDGHKICLADQETTVNNIYTESGISWYYILDTTNTRFKLPRTKWNFEGVRDNVGDYVSESLPNITGTFTTYVSQVTQASGTGVFSSSTSTLSNVSTTSGSGVKQTVDFSASNSSSTYQDNAPVQERATQMYLYFYVGEYTQTAIEQTAGITSEQLNNKADLTLSNVTNANFLTKFQGCGQVYLKTSYVNGTSGYNIWSNGYCEQWGVSPSGGDQATVTISLLKTFSDTNYNVLGIQRDGPAGNYTNGLRVINYGTSSFQINYRTGGTATAYWKACGYLAEGEY